MGRGPEHFGTVFVYYMSVIKLASVGWKMEGSTVKHVKHVTRTVLARANAFEDAICYGGQILADLLGAFGGASPILDYLTEKCEIPLEEEV